MFNIYATDYAPVDPITPPCDIVPIFIGYKGENKARCLVFDLTECVNTFGDGGFVITFIRHGDELPYLVTNTDRLDNNAIWIITSTDTAVDGYGMVQLQYIVDDVVCKSALYRTVTFDSNDASGDVPDPYEDLLAQISAYAAQAEGAATTATAAADKAATAVENGIKTERSQRIAADEDLQTQITSLKGLAGAPVMANTAAAMTNSSKIYVYTGSEAGYTFGHWYYYNGAQWVSGGVYQASAVETDKTLTVSDMAADAAVVGEKIEQCMTAFVKETITDSAIASFDDGADDVPVKDLVVNIEPVQSGSGDPSPTNVRAISGWDSANVYRMGFNWFDKDTVTDGKIINGSGDAASHGNAFCSDYIPVKKETNYYTNAYGTGHFFTVRYFNEAKVFIGSSDLTAAGVFNTGEASYARINSLKSSIPPEALIVNLSDPLHNGAYDAYNGNTYNVSFGSAGTVYGGTLDVTTGVLTVTHGVQILTGAESVYYNTTSVFFQILTTIPTNAWETHNVCNYYRTTGAASDGNYCQYGGDKQLRIYDFAYTDAASYKAWLAERYAAGVPVMVAYPLATPIVYQLSPTEIKTLLGNNNIWSDTGSVASCEYRADTKLYLEKLTNPDSDMTADSNIASGQYFMVNNTLYLATAAIASGATIVPGTNCTETSLAAALNAINA